MNRDKFGGMKMQLQRYHVANSRTNSPISVLQDDGSFYDEYHCSSAFLDRIQRFQLSPGTLMEFKASKKIFREDRLHKGTRYSCEEETSCFEHHHDKKTKKDVKEASFLESRSKIMFPGLVALANVAFLCLERDFPKERPAKRLCFEWETKIPQKKAVRITKARRDFEERQTIGDFRNPEVEQDSKPFLVTQGISSFQENLQSTWRISSISINLL